LRRRLADGAAAAERRFTVGSNFGIICLEQDLSCIHGDDSKLSEGLSLGRFVYFGGNDRERWKRIGEAFFHAI
jgi:hypothetical protein